ncbi:MAG: hypothetical protein K9L17_09175 [Clostridiales bacterium]|nr:hypothetical protein [Clostridiales bacterium]MCF8022849.1 hypothetical protein [Clostridiales bacterium]
MICNNLIEKLIEKEACNKPIRVAIAGTGFIGRGLIIQLSLMKGIEVTAAANRTRDKAVKALEQCETNKKHRCCNDQESLNRALQNGEIGVVSDPLLLAPADVDIICDCTDDPLLGANLGLAAIEHGKHFIANPEADSAVGPMLNELAKNKGLVYSGADGDEPGVTMNLYRYVSLLGLDIIAAGKFKGYYNRYATPESVKPWSDKFAQNPFMIASAADGTKMNIEMTLLANATGLVPEIRGMHCPAATLETVPGVLSLKEQEGILSSTGVVEVVQEVKPSGGVFVVATTSHPQIIKNFQYLKMGDGPNYLFYRPYHLAHVEMGISIIRAVLARDATIAPAGPPVADVLAVAKRNIKAGEILDNIGGYTFYGLIDRAHIVKEQKLLPVAMAPGTRVIRSIKIDEPITLDDVEIDKTSTFWKLRKQQAQMVSTQPPPGSEVI